MQSFLFQTETLMKSCFEQAASKLQLKLAKLQMTATEEPVSPLSPCRKKSPTCPDPVVVGKVILRPKTLLDGGMVSTIFIL